MAKETSRDTSNISFFLWCTTNPTDPALRTQFDDNNRFSASTLHHGQSEGFSITIVVFADNNNPTPQMKAMTTRNNGPVLLVRDKGARTPEILPVTMHCRHSRHAHGTMSTIGSNRAGSTGRTIGSRSTRRA